MSGHSLGSHCNPSSYVRLAPSYIGQAEQQYSSISDLSSPDQDRFIPAKNLAERLEEFRVQMRWSPAELGPKAGKSKSVGYTWLPESGKKNQPTSKKNQRPPLTTLRALVDRARADGAQGVSLDIFAEGGPMPATVVHRRLASGTTVAKDEGAATASNPLQGQPGGNSAPLDSGDIRMAQHALNELLQTILLENEVARHPNGLDELIELLQRIKDQVHVMGYDAQVLRKEIERLYAKRRGQPPPDA